MKKYDSSLIEKIRSLRSLGKTYTEINTDLRVRLPKSTLSYLCKRVLLPIEYTSKLEMINKRNRERGRLIAAKTNKIKREKFLNKLDKVNKPIAKTIYDKKTAKIVLSALCLGEASKHSTGGPFSLGSSDPRIITIFLNLLKYCFNFDPKKLRLTVQCRADQNTEKLEKFWSKVTGFPKSSFYKAQVDKRTAGKPTKKKDYMGVLRIDYFDTRVQLELESLANLIYNELSKKGPVVYR